MRSAVELFEARGFEQTTTAMIAAAGGVSEMTFFRHFGSKDGVLFDDPYDPMIVKAVAQQSSELPAIWRVSEGLRAAWSQISLPKAALVRRRIRIAGSSPTLRAAMWANMARTEDAVVAQLTSDGTPAPVARIAAAAVLAAVTASLTAWAADGEASVDAFLALAFDVMDGGPADA